MKYKLHYGPNSPLSWDKFYHCMEWGYTMDVIYNLSLFLDDSWLLIFTDQVASLPSFDGTPKEKVIVVLVGDEDARVPPYYNQVGYVFKHYLKSDCEAGNVYPIPQGLMTGLLNLPYRKIEDRSTDLMFFGNPHGSRKAILQGLYERLHDKCKVFFGEGNAETFKMHNYSHRLFDSKISLDLMGGKSSETFRYYESLRYGCVTLSYPKKDNWIYRDSPTIIPNWDDLDSVAEEILNLLSDTKRMQEISIKSFTHWQQKLSASSVALKMVGVLLEKNANLV